MDEGLLLSGGGKINEVFRPKRLTMWLCKETFEADYYVSVNFQTQR